MNPSLSPSPHPLDVSAPHKLAPLQEVFSSIQGEGVYVGKRQVFVRFAHCHLKCAYCDTPMTSASGQCHVETLPGSGETAAYPNPMRPDVLRDVISDLWRQARHHSVSFTGGEPLLYHAFLRELLPQVRAQSPVYLETSGTQADFLANVLPWLDYVAMDIKLPSATGEASQFENHRAFYQALREHPSVECFVKLVFNEQTTLEEMAEIASIVPDRHVPIILQPETGLRDRTVSVRPAQVFRLENALTPYFSDVRVIPQTHKMLNVL